jgi:signal transduction histidine kinase
LKPDEHAGDTIRRLLGFYRAASFAVLCVLMLFSNHQRELGLNIFQIVYLVFLFLGTVFYFVLLGYRKILAVLLTVEYFAVFFHAYVEPRFIIIEFIWIPGIVAAQALILPRKFAAIAVPVIGIPGFLFFSYGCIYNISVNIGDFILPYTVIVLLYTTPVTLLAILLNRACYRMEETEKRYSNLEIENKRLNEINHVTSQRIFSLQNDTTQRERNRLSKEIHDTAGYVFINLIMMLQAASAILHRDIQKADRLIGEARDYAERGINEIRHLLRDIRDYSPITLSLQNELYNVGESFQRATNVTIDLEYGPWPKTFSKNIDSFFIAFMQEALTNALKHGHAANVSIVCWDNGSHTGMTVTDNGGGSELPIKKGIGITAMEDAATHLGGSIAIRTGENGVKISAVIPRIRNQVKNGGF